MTTRILVPLDVNGCAHDVVARALWLGRLAKAEIILLACFDEPTGVDKNTPTFVDGATRSVDEMLKTELERSLQPFAQMVRNVDLPLQVMVRHGSPAHTILSVAADLRVDIIVMGTHGRTGLKRVVFGSVAEEVLRRSPCPVLVEPAGRGLAAVLSTAMNQALAEGDG